MSLPDRVVGQEEEIDVAGDVDILSVAVEKVEATIAGTVPLDVTEVVDLGSSEELVLDATVDMVEVEAITAGIVVLDVTEVIEVTSSEVL